MFQKIIKNSLRELVFGLEDGLVSTLGVVTGMASGLPNSSIVILSGVVVVLVESLSMAAGSYLSNKAQYDFKKAKHSSIVASAFVMFFAYMFGGSIPLIPYLFMPVSLSIQGSVVATVVALFMLGFYKGVITKTPKLRSALEMVTVSLLAAGLGYLIGQIGSRYIDIMV
jgi:vacuolar iron transporter family protein